MCLFMQSPTKPTVLCYLTALVMWNDLQHWNVWACVALINNKQVPGCFTGLSLQPQLAARSYQGRKLTERTHFYSHSCMWAPPKHRGGIKQAAQHWQVCTGCTKQWRWSISLCRLDLGNAMGWSWWCSEWRWVGSSSSSGAKLVYWSLPKPTHTHTQGGGGGSVGGAISRLAGGCS